MENNGLGEQGIKAVLTETGSSTVQPKTALKAVGKQRPNATPLEFSRRKWDLDLHKDSKEFWTGAPATTIEPSEKQISTDLELKPLLLGTLLTTGSWQAPFLSQYFGITNTEEIKNRFSSPTKCNTELQMIKATLGEDEFLNKVSQYLDTNLNQAVEKEEKFRFGKLTVGLELEIIKHRSSTKRDEQAKQIDSLQEVGFPVTYDALREIPLPKSFSTHEQLKAFLLMIQSDLIKPGNRAGIHLNIGGFNRLDSNLYLLQYMSTAAGLFDKDIDANNVFHPLGEENKHWAKALYQGDSNSPRGLPFVVRPNGVIEFRWLTGCTDYMKTAKGLETFVQTCEAIAAWQKVNHQDPNVTEKDKQLAGVWDSMKTQALAQFKTYNIPNALFDYFDNDAEACADLQSKIMNRVATYDNINELSKKREVKNRKRREKMYEVFRNGRGEIKKILQETSAVTSLETTLP